MFNQQRPRVRVHASSVDRPLSPIDYHREAAVRPLDADLSQAAVDVDFVTQRVSTPRDVTARS
jgi:hypothetical protein